MGIYECNYGGDGDDDSDADSELTAEDPVHRHLNPAVFFCC